MLGSQRLWLFLSRATVTPLDGHVACAACGEDKSREERCSLVPRHRSHAFLMDERLPLLALMLICPGLALAEPVFYPAVSGNTGPDALVYSSLDEPLAQPMIRRSRRPIPTSPSATRTC